MPQPLKFFAGSSHPELAQEVAKELGVPLSAMDLKRFACGEIYAKPHDTVRGCDVFVLQTATAHVNEDYMELFIILDALKRSFAKGIHVVIPHYGYARQDRVASPREPISAKLMADLMSSAGAQHVITMNLHSDQEQGFFNFPVDNLNAAKLFVKYVKDKKFKDGVIVAPDIGSAKMAKKFADEVGMELAIINKVRPKHNVAEVMHLVGDVAGKTCIIFDDLVDTAGTTLAAKEALMKNGANKDVYLIATHAVFSDPAVERLKKAAFKEVIVSNTIPLPKEKHFKGLQVISVAGVLAKAIQNIHESKSVSSVY